MKTQKLLMAGITLALIGSSALFLLQRKGMYHLGSPGVKVIPQTVFDEERKIVATNIIDLPERVLHYQSHLEPVSVMERTWLPADTTFGKRSYYTTNRFSRPIHLTVVMMGTDRTSIHKPEHCLSSQGWKITQSEKDQLPIEVTPPYVLPVKKLQAQGSFKVKGDLTELRAVYVYWFVTDQYVASEHGERMWLMSRELIRTGTLQRWAYVSALSVCLPGEEQAAYEEIKKFIHAAVPQFQNNPRNPNAARPHLSSR